MMFDNRANDEDFVDREKPLEFFELNVTRIDSTVHNNSIFHRFNLRSNKPYC